MSDCQCSFLTGIGQDSHRFLSSELSKPLILAGIIFEDEPGLSADSDGDVVLHAICNAITSITHEPILGKIAKELLEKDGITDSSVYLEKALSSLKDLQVEHVALSIEAKKPRMQSKINLMRAKIAQIMQIEVEKVGMTVTSGDGLTAFGCGEGVQCFCLLTVRKAEG